MNILEIIIIAIGLSMDAFAVSITLGLSVEKPTIEQMTKTGFYFGFFQALMPLFGYIAGINFTYIIQDFDHWIAFALLGIIGGRMIMESFNKEAKKMKEKPFRFITMLLLSIATSIDALAVGLTFSFFDINIFISIIIIGITTFIISIFGVKIGNIFGTKYKSKAEFLGGAILICIGIKILIEHLFFY